MRKNRKLVFKYLLLISVLMLMMLLCACRTRLTNNTDVASTIADEDGYLYSEYQMRRDMLGEPVAERPIFTGWSSDDSSEEYYDPGTDALENYDPGTLDEWDEPEDTSTSSPSSRPSNSPSSSGSGSGNGSGSGSGTSGGQSGSEEQKPSQPEKPSVIEFTVELKPNGGYIKKPDKSSIRVVSGSPFGELPTPIHDDKNKFFIGWFTEDGETPITSESIVESEEPFTLYAHWGTNYTFKLNTDGGLIDPKEAEKTSEKGLYPELPSPTREGFHFMGWYLPDGKTKVEAGQECKSNQALKARWVDNAKFWEDRYSVASNKEEFKDSFYSSDNVAGLVKGERKEKAEDKPKYLFVGIDDFSEANATAVINEQRETFKDSTIVVIPNGGDNVSQVYKLILLKYMYGDASTITDDDITNAAKELNVKLPESGSPYYYESEVSGADTDNPEVKG